MAWCRREPPAASFSTLAGLFGRVPARYSQVDHAVSIRVQQRIAALVELPARKFASS
jgi:hypothetical protein